MLTWLYDIRLESGHLSFVLFRFWTVHVTTPADIEQVKEVSRLSPGAWTAYNFKNRLFARAFLITLRHGWFTRKILVTPPNASALLDWCASHNVSVFVPPG